MKTYLPSPPLQPFIQLYRIIESRDEKVNRVLPDSTPAIAFRFKGQLRYIEGEQPAITLPASVISGLRNTVRLINYQPDTAAIIVQFKVAGAAAFFKTPLHELFGHSVSLDHFVNRQQLTDLEEQLSVAASDAQRVLLLDNFLLAQLRFPKQDELVLHALHQIHAANGDVNMKALATAHFISQDAFEKRFRKVMGTTPKQMASIIRMRAVLQQPPADRNLTRLALDAGYFDQAHFNRSFKQFTGLTPTAFFQAPSFW
ncbi:helix-turn-helix transcriptional regulator [Chitinophaga varians]|uniref:Helix-turn-helix transcriptional regulator n=1 Tax=Chitinophaga varians TaxID=2202339 RepID=A0A847RBN5_9BACT|nr:helix-turn-helix transcriptional regulator [Chitinophaga varians]NLR64479.1 helix-turn-helix transcriptional regulator [Chitinophaga varians]